MFQCHVYAVRSACFFMIKLLAPLKQTVMLWKILTLTRFWSLLDNDLYERSWCRTLQYFSPPLKSIYKFISLRTQCYFSSCLPCVALQLLWRGGSRWGQFFSCCAFSEMCCMSTYSAVKFLSFVWFAIDQVDIVLDFDFWFYRFNSRNKIAVCWASQHQNSQFWPRSTPNYPKITFDACEAPPFFFFFFLYTRIAQVGFFMRGGLFSGMRGVGLPHSPCQRVPNRGFLGRSF